MAEDPNDKGQPLNLSETPGPSGVDALSDDDRAGAGMEIGRMLNQIDAQDKADPFPTHVDVPKDIPADSASMYTRLVQENQEDRSDRRDVHRVYLLLILALLGSAAIAGALLFWRLGGDDTPPLSAGVAAPAEQPAPAADAAPVHDTDAPQPGTSDGRLWYFTNTEGLGLYTIALQGDGTAGPIDVIEDTTDTGTYSWVDDTLTIDFTRKITMDDGYVVTDPWTFECAGTPESAQMTCDVTVQDWIYRIEGGLEVLGEDSWPALAVPR